MDTGSSWSAWSTRVFVEAEIERVLGPPRRGGLFSALGELILVSS